MTHEQKKARARKWWRENRSKAALVKKAGKIAPPIQNGNLVDLVKAFQALHSATSDGQLKSDLSKVFVHIVMKSSNQ